MHRLRFLSSLLSLILLAGTAMAHVGGHPSIHDTMAGVMERVRQNTPAESLATMTAEDVQKLLTEEERHVLSTEFLNFKVNVPVTVTVFVQTEQAEVPFWLQGEGYAKTELTVTADGKPFTGYQKAFDAGKIGLGYPGFDAIRYPYFVVLSPKKAGKNIEVTEMYPGRHRLGVLEAGASILVDKPEVKVEALPESLTGHMLLCGIDERKKETQVLRIFRATNYPATTKPDHVVLTWSEDPKTTQTIQWRTSTAIARGVVEYHPVEDPAAVKTLLADQSLLTDRNLLNDKDNHRYTVVLRNLKPGSAYTYRVGNGEAEGWTEPKTFRTAPAGIEPFSFVYMGDAQNGLDTWGKLVAKAHASQPQAAFYVMAGDLVNKGIERDDWDSFFHNATGVYDQRTLVPVIGNHEDQGDSGPWMYLSLFDLPKNGPQGLTPERAYSFTYSNALFVMLDSNLPPESQTVWLEQQLANSDAKWKFVVYHHPAYSSAPRRDNIELRAAWIGLFDKYHVDLALQGHDHAYLRTYPMKGEERVGSAAEGTIYIVATSGTKFYEQDARDYTEFGMTNVATYQVLDITIEEHRLVYKAYDIDGQIRDEFVIEK